MSDAALGRRAGDALAARLPDGERVLDACFAWVAVRRDRVPLLVQNRHPGWLVVTDARVLVVPRPRRGHKPGRSFFDAPFDRVEVTARRRRGLITRWDLSDTAEAEGADVRSVVVEMRPGHARLRERIDRERATARGAAPRGA